MATWCKPKRFKSVSVVFAGNAPLNISIPSSWSQLPVFHFLGQDVQMSMFPKTQTSKVEFCERCIYFQGITQRHCTCFIDDIAWKTNNSLCDSPKKTHRLVLWVSPPRFSSESAVFTFNASLKDVAPSSLIVFTGEQNTNCEEKSMMEYLLCALFILSFVSVAFIFNASNNDSAPFGSIQLSDWWFQSKWFMDKYYFIFLKLTPNV